MIKKIIAITVIAMNIYCLNSAMDLNKYKRHCYNFAFGASISGLTTTYLLKRNARLSKSHLAPILLASATGGAIVTLRRHKRYNQKNYGL